MKVLFITHYDNMYGANNAMLKLIKGITEDEGNSVIAVVPARGQLVNELEKCGVKCIISSVTQWQATYVSFVRQMVKKIKRKKQIEIEIDNLYEKLKDEKIDIIHSNSSVICHGAVLSKKLNAKHVWHIREFSKEHFGMRYFYSDDIVRQYYQDASRLICISDALRDNYIEKYENANIVRIYDGVDLKANTNYENTTGIEKIKFVYVGYLFNMKQQLEVIRACAKLNEKSELYKNKYEMHFVGDGKADYKEVLQNEIRKNCLDNVFLDGFVQNVNDYISKCDVGIIASRYEGFGLVTVEYMLNHLPVIGYKSGGTAEIVQDGKTGILFKDENQLVNAMIKLIDDCKLRKEYGDNGYRRALSEFSEERNVKAVRDLYMEILNK